MPPAEEILAFAAADDLDTPMGPDTAAPAPAAWSLLRSGGRSHLTVSCLVLDQRAEHMVLVEHTASGQLRQPGGHVDPEDSTLRAAALREVSEECGAQAAAALHLCPTPIAVRVFTVGSARCHSHLDVLFEASLPDHVRLSGADGARWVPIAALPRGTAPDISADLPALLLRARLR